MSLIYLGLRKCDGTPSEIYIDTDQLSNSEYAEFCEHRNNLIRYYGIKDDEKALLKATILGINIKQIIKDAENFVAYNLVGCFDDWREIKELREEVEDTIYNILFNND